MIKLALGAGEFIAWAGLFLGVFLVLAYRRARLSSSSCVLGVLLLSYWALGSAPDG